MWSITLTFEDNKKTTMWFYLKKQAEEASIEVLKDD